LRPKQRLIANRRGAETDLEWPHTKLRLPKERYNSNAKANRSGDRRE